MRRRELRGTWARVRTPVVFGAVAVLASALLAGASSAFTSPELIARINTHGQKPCGSAVYGRYLYVANFGSDTLARLDPVSNRVVKTLRVGWGPCGVVAGGGAPWVENFDGDNDVHDDCVWVSNEVDGIVSRVDPATNEVVDKVRVGPAPADGVRGPDGLEWIPNQGDGTVSLIDPASNAVVGTVDSGGLTFVVRTGFGSMWVDDFTGNTLSRFRPGS